MFFQQNLDQQMLNGFDLATLCDFMGHDCIEGFVGKKYLKQSANITCVQDTMAEVVPLTAGKPGNALNV